MDQMPVHSPSASHDMPMPDMPARCSMNMLFTWDYTNTCVIFHWWHIRSVYSFLFSFVAVAALATGYEFVRHTISLWEARTLAVASDSRAMSLYRLKKSVFYGFQIGYSFMLMLVFMTYNGWLMLAVVLGAIGGHWLWGHKSTGRGLECH
ncbi:Ctr-domain-containing protein [Yamadazyma tenuis ATCC 10573]|uniref:Copper transport protein n=2 Tax=Candida tenuis TaxID=2315449 RepID=G3B369_CANTC|nr:Ctr-domain-containing protein [Yamadazyma tenuis ATCC 10573]EGV64094.1 Ctr-domain-containing protein [Yamadazyma tenuis ATCC 10573]